MKNYSQRMAMRWQSGSKKVRFYPFLGHCQTARGY